MAKVRLTAGRIASFHCSDGKGQEFLWCDSVPGLGIRATVGSKQKRYIFQAKVKGKSVRITIGDVKAWSIESAQAEARRLQVSIDQGLHASLLPKYRGAAPVNWAMINGETETGVSVIRISQRIDAGDVVGRRATPIDPMETAGELEQRLADMGPDLMIETLALQETGQLHGLAQDDAGACRAPRLSKTDGTVRFDQPAAAVQCRVHGLNPWPGCTVQVAGSVVKIGRVAVADDGDEVDTSGTPGEILDDHTIACLEGRVRLVTVQPPGGSNMSFEDYLRGHPVPPGAGVEPR